MKKKHKKTNAAQFMLDIQQRLSESHWETIEIVNECPLGAGVKVVEDLFKEYGVKPPNHYTTIAVASSEIYLITQIPKKIQKLLGCDTLQVPILSKEVLNVLEPKGDPNGMNMDDVTDYLNGIGRKLDVVMGNAQAKVNHCKHGDDLADILEDLLTELIVMDKIKFEGKDLLQIEWEDCVNTEQLVVQTRGLASKHIVIIPEDLASMADLATMNALLASQIHKLKEIQGEM